MDEGSSVGPASSAPTLTASDIVIYVTGINGTTGGLNEDPKAAKFGIATTVRAKVLAPNGTLHLRQNGSFTGAFVAKWVILGIGATATFEGGFNLRGIELQPGDLVQARAAHSAELLGDGRVLITGGIGPSGVLDSAEVYDPAPLTSSALSNLLTSPRTEHTSTLLPQSETLLVAGDDGFGLLNTTELFNSGTEAFRTLTATVQVLRSGHTATALLDGRVLITGGQSSGALDDAEVFDAQSAVIILPPYDPETATFEILPNGLTTPRWDHTATLLPDGRILITGGRNETGVLNSAEIFDPVTETFTNVTNTLTTPRAAHTATLLPDGTVLILGGEDATGVLTTAEMFDPATEMFTAVATGLGTARRNHTATLLPFGQVLVTGGTDGTSILATTELYGLAGGDTAAPNVSQVLPPDATTGVEPNQIVGVRFTEPVDVTTLTAANVTLTNGGPVTGVVSPAEEGLMVFVVPDAPLASGTTYTLSLTSNIRDTAGNTLPAVATTFTTAAEPVITDFSPQAGPEGTEVTITGQNFDPVASRNEVRFNGALASVSSATDTTIVTAVPTGATTGPITVTTAGGTATSATDFNVVTGPVITDVTPLTGPVGTPVTITGVNFDAEPSNNQVTFSGETAPVTAIITSATTTEIKTTVPQNARTGLITVTTPQGSDDEPFEVTLPGDFSVSVGPVTGQVVQGDQIIFAVSATGEGTFTGLVEVELVGLPGSVTHQFVSNLLAPGAQTFLTVFVPSSTAPGLVPFSVNAIGSIAGQTLTRTAGGFLNVIAAGTTNATGRVLGTDETPLPGVTITRAEFISGAIVLTGPQTVTDAGGNFLLQNIPSGQQILFVDGSTAQVPGRTYPPVDIVWNFPDGQTTRPPFIIYLPELDVEHPIDLPLDGSGATTQEVRASTPLIPDLELIIPAGTTILDNGGNIVNQITISPVPTDRSPMPPPDGIVARMLFTIQPGLAKPSTPLPMCFPNGSKFFPGQQADLYFFNLELGDWDTWGTGTTTMDGRRVCSDPGFGLPTFAWHFASGGDNNDEGDCCDGDPVDLFSGQFVVDETDFALPGLVPITLTRHYASQNTQAGPFGIGTTHSYDWRLTLPPAQDPPAFLALSGPNGRQAAFSFQSATGALVNTTEPWLAGARITGSFGNLPFILRFKDGSEWDFNGQGGLIAQRDRVGNQLTIVRGTPGPGDPGEVLEVRDEGSERFLQFVYGPGDRIISIIDPIGRTVQYAYDPAAHLLTVTDPMGHVIRYTYNAAGFLETVTDKRGNVRVTNEYDTAGRVIRQTMADGGVWQFGYQLNGGLITQVTVTEPSGIVRRQRLNDAGFSTDRADAFGQVSLRKRAIGTNFLLSVTDPLRRETTVTYDSSGNQKTVTYPDGSVTLFEYDSTFSQVTKVTQVLDESTALVTINEYDQAGNLIARVDPAGVRTEMTYNSFGQQTSVKTGLQTDPPTTFGFDASGNLTRITDPLGHVTTRAYDAVGRLITLRDGGGSSTHFRYDALDRLSEIADSRQGIKKFTYDENGNLSAITDAKNRTVTLTYDPLDRLETRTDSLGRIESHEYNPNGTLKRITDRKNQQASFEYDANNRLVVTQYVDAVVTRAYDAVGRVSRISDSSSGVIEFVYDARGRLVQNITKEGPLNFTYDAVGRRTSMIVNGDQPINYSYDAASRLTQVSQGTLTVDLQYDGAGRRMSLGYPNGATASYIYDAASRVTELTYQTPATQIESLTYVYDASGNRTRVSRSNGSATDLPNALQASYDEANEQIQVDTSTLAYDDNGNLTSDGSNTYQWDGRNRLIGITGTGLSASFEYDALGRRVSKTINGVTTRYVYDDKNIVQEIIAGSLAKSYLRSLAPDEPFIRHDGNDEEYYHTDVIGSVLALTDSSGAIAVTYTYDAYGNSTVTGSSTNPFQYTGREKDNTGLYFYRNRYYAPSLSRFISEDPLGFENPDGAINLYLYANGNPLKFSDPNGLWSIQIPPAPRKPALDPSWGTPMFIFLTCLETCSGAHLILTSTHEDTPEHDPGTPHRRGLAVDIKIPADPDKVLCCAAQCGAKYGHGGDHLHFQLVCGLGGCKRRGNLPIPPGCGCM